MGTITISEQTLEDKISRVFFFYPEDLLVGLLSFPYGRQLLSGRYESSGVRILGIDLVRSIWYTIYKLTSDTELTSLLRPS